MGFDGMAGQGKDVEMSPRRAPRAIPRPRVAPGCGTALLFAICAAGVCRAQALAATNTGSRSPEKASSAAHDSPAQTPLRERLAAIAAAHHGKVALYASEGAGGPPPAGTANERAVGLAEDEPVQTASVIKLAILYHAMVEIRTGRAAWNEPIVLKPGEAVGGSGMLHFFDTPLQLTLKDVLTMMVIVSDNTATNLMIDRFGLEAINARVEELGLRKTHLYKKVFRPATGPLPADQPRFGLGKTTPREMATLMRQIGMCSLRQAPSSAPSSSERPTPVLPAGDPSQMLPMDEADRAVCAVGLQILKDQFYRDTIPRYLEKADTHGPAIASKTGSLDAVRNDVALVAGKNGPIVMAIFTYENQDHSWTVDNEGEMTIATLAREIVHTWSPDGLDGARLVPGLGTTAGRPVSER